MHSRVVGPGSGPWKRAFITLAAVLAIAVSAQPGPARAKELPLELFAQLPQVSSPKLSPDGKYLAMIQPYKGRNHLFIQPLGGGDPVVIPPSGKFEISWFDWASNERLLVGISFQGWRRTTPTTETRLIAINRDGSNMRSVVRPKKNKKKTGTRLGNSEQIAQFQDNVVDYLYDDPDHFLLSIDGDDDNSNELRRVNIHTGQYIEFYGEMRGVQNWMTDRQGEVRFAWGVDTISVLGTGRTQKRLIYYRHADGNFSDFSDAGIHRQGFGTWDLAENPDHAYMGGTGEQGRNVVIKYDLREERVLETYEHEKYDAVGLIYGGADYTPVGVRFAGGVDPIIFDAAWAKRYRIINKALPNSDNVIVSTDAARNLHLIHSSSDIDSGVFYVFDQEAMRIDQLALIYDGLDTAEMAPMKSVFYEARDGLRIPAILTLPLGSDGKNLPTVVLPHGGPHARDTISFDYWVQFLANRGYAVLQPNFRGSTGYGKEFEEAGYEQWGLKMQDDVTDGTRWLIDQGIADPERICIVGASYGGYAALMGVVKEPDLYRCAASLNGIGDIPRHMRSKRKYIGGALGTDHINQKGQHDISPEAHVKTINTPILLVATEDDRTVDYRQSKDMARALKKAGNKHKYVELEEGDHGLTTEESRRIFLTELERFLKKYIGT